MKKRTIWTIACIMALTFIALIYSQMRYFDEIVETRKEQFDETIGRVLMSAQRHVEMEEARATIEQEIEASAPENIKKQRTAFRALEDSLRKLSEVDTALHSRQNASLQTEAQKEKRRERMRQRFLYQKDLLNKVIYDIVYKPLDQPIEKHVDFAELDRFIQTELQRRGVDIKYHFSVKAADGAEIYRCSDYEEPGGAKVYKHTIFPYDPPIFRAVINVHFPHTQRYVYASARFLVPTLFFTFILLVVFIYTIWIIFRQKRLTEMKNDFVNNMTHELKTPISTISLAAQMLSDPVISKNESALSRYSRVITDETKRLRFLVDKVLQTSLFEKGQGVTFKMDELDANAIIEEVASTFNVKVHNVGGEIVTQLDAEDPIICADQMHFTNVIFNLLDNAVKYRRQDATNEDGTPVRLQLKLRTENEGHHLKIYVSDNGMGIKRENLKRVFKQFFREEGGNVHNVKGSGLGLAYVASVIQAHKGRIHAESTVGEGTTFIITLPLMDE